MTRLIVDEGGARRAFKMGEGVLSIGTGAEARLKLTSPDVAALHATLELAGGVATLHIQPGVVPPTVGGVPARGDVKLAPGVPVKIGSATLVLEGDGPAPAPAAAPAAARPAARRPVAARASQRSGSRARRGKQEEEEEQERPVRRVSHGTPTWVIVVPLLIAIGGIGFFVMRGLMSAEQETSVDLAGVYFNKALKAMEFSKLSDAEFELDRIPMETVSPELAERIAAMRADIADTRAAGDLARENMRGTEYLEQQLKRFERNHLKGVADPARVRLFLKRCRYFRERWPRHDELGWVDRQERRFGGAVDLSQPPTLEDVRFEVKMLTKSADLRDYAQCFQVLDEFLAECSAEDRAQASKLVDEKRAEREEWFMDRMQRARFEYEREEIGKSAGWLVAIIRYVGDAEMANRAATDFLKFDDADARLRGYRMEKPEIFAQLMGNGVIGPYVREKGLDVE